MSQPPTIGRIVLYTLTEHDVSQINTQRGTASGSNKGNFVNVGDTYPMLICRAWGTTPGSAVNGQVFLDGADTLWVTSRTEGGGPGYWQWPPRV